MSKPKKKPQKQKKTKFKYMTIIYLFIFIISIYNIVAYSFYETYDNVDITNFTAGNVSGIYKYNTTNGYLTCKNCATGSGIPKYNVLTLNSTSIYPISFTQVFNTESVAADQYRGIQGIMLQNTTSGVNWTIHAEINAQGEAFPKTVFYIWLEITLTDGAYRFALGNVTGCTGFNTSTWYFENITINKINNTNYNITYYAQDIGGNIKCQGTVSNNAYLNNGTMSTFDTIKWMARDTHSSGSQGYRFDEVWITTTNNFTTNPSYNISVYSKPSDINTSVYEDINFTANVTYANINYSNLSNSYANFYYLLNTSLNNGCALFFQQTCALPQTYISKRMNKENNTQFNTTLTDDEIFPAYYPYNYSVYNQNNNASYTLYNNNNILFNVTNFSTQLQQFFISIEFQANNITSTSNNMLIYYCNSTYTSGNPALSTSCELIDTFGVTQSYNHGKHQTVPVTIQSVKKTQQSYFIFVSTANTQSNGWRFMYVTNSSYNNQSFKIGNYNTWSVTNNIFDIHIHQFMGTDKLQYFVNYTDNTTSPIITSSSIVYDFYNITNQAPSAPNYITPTCPNNYSIDVNGNVSINFSWTTSVDLNNDTPYYSLYLLSTLLSANQTNTTYNFLFHPSFITYTSFIRVCDIYNACDVGTLDCNINICVPSWQLTTQPCVADVKLISYQDINNCNSAYNLSVNNGTYTNCTAIIHNQQEYSDDQKIIIILIILMIIAAALSFYSTYFLVLDAGLSILLGISLIYYHYPDATFVAAFFFAIIFLLAAIFTKTKRK